MRSTVDSVPFILPPPMVPGDAIRVVAPASRFDRALVLRGLGWLRERYRVEFERTLFDRDGSFAGTDGCRLEQLNRALLAPHVRAIVAARGGYGVTRIAHRVDWQALRRSPKWLVGFSDITALHAEAARVEVASLHAHNVAGLGRGDATTRAEWVLGIESPTRCRTLSGLEAWHGGKARGPLAGGNLTILFTLAAAGRLHLPRGSILLLEDVAEPSYRIDRMLTALLISGHLREVAAVVVGDFTDCPKGQFALSALEVIRERLDPLGVPMLAGLGFGHGSRNVPVPLGMTGEVDASAGRFTICPDGGQAF